MFKMLNLCVYLVLFLFSFVYVLFYPFSKKTLKIGYVFCERCMVKWTVVSVFDQPSIDFWIQRVIFTLIGWKPFVSWVKMRGFVGVNSVHYDACVKISWHPQLSIVPADHSRYFDGITLFSLCVSLLLVCVSLSSARTAFGRLATGMQL
jgi:hypothetical protein